MRFCNVLLLQNTNCVGNVRKEDSIRLRAITHQELRNHAKRCNNLVHSMKYCTINKRTIWCAICADEGHETEDCESVKILIMQNRQQNSQNRGIYQFCDMPGHSAKTCRKTNNNQQSTFPSYNCGSPNKPYEHRDKNRNGFLRTNHQNGLK